MNYVKGSKVECNQIILDMTIIIVQQINVTEGP